LFFHFYLAFNPFDSKRTAWSISFKSNVLVADSAKLETSSSDAFAILRDAEVPLAIHDFSPIFHHKYAIIDEGFSQSDPQVINGSHHWT